MMSSKLTARVLAAGLTCLKSVLEQSGVLTYTVLGLLSEDELGELCLRVRAAGFGLGHARALRELCYQACADDSRQGEKMCDEVPVTASLLSPKLYFRLARSGLQGLEPILAQCGVQSVARLEQLSESECAELDGSIAAAGFTSDSRTLSELCLQRSNALRAAPLKGTPSSASAVSSSQLAELARTPRLLQTKKDDPLVKEEVEVAAAEGGGSDRVTEGVDMASDTAGESADPPAKRPKSAGESADSPAKRPKTEAHDRCMSGESPSHMGMLSFIQERRDKAASSAPLTNADCMTCSKVRVSRDYVDEVLKDVRSLRTEVVRYRDRVSGKLLDVRIPEGVLTLLRFRGACSGKPVSEERIARLALDIMEEQGFDPVRAIASLSPESWLAPAGATRLLGQGYSGVVFLEEKTGVVVKVMLEDFAESEYKIFCDFADAGLAAKPISLFGPVAVPGGSIWSIHMEPITHTLASVLDDTCLKGPRYGLNPAPEAVTRRIAEAIVKGLQRMWDNGLVHGDLHLSNLALKDAHVQPLVQFLDFGRSARNVRASQSATAESMRAGHECDVFRLLTSLIEGFEELKEEKREQWRECEKELRELQRGSKAAATLSSWAREGKMRLPPDVQVDGSCEYDSQLHGARQIAGLQAFLAEEPKALNQAEAGYNIVLASIFRYAQGHLDMAYDGEVGVSNRRLRQAISKRLQNCHRVYFKSNLFWGC
jgi:tRNA A-37 threonylcarbamoyl transferase component Bud32